MGALRGVLVVVAGCTGAPLVAPGAPHAAACASATTPGIATGSALAVAATASGATVVWTGAAGVMRVDLSAGGDAVSAPALAWPGAYDRAVAAAVDGEVVVGAIAGEDTTLVGAALGVGGYRELALLGGIAGASPVVVAGGARVAPTVTYGGMFVEPIDSLWTAHTAQLAVLTADARELAATAVGDDAVIAWPAGDDCFVTRAAGVATGTTWQAAGACGAPRLASLAGGVALVFERDGDVYLARAASADVHPETATRIAAGASAPRIVAAGGRYWISYVGADGELAAGFVDDAGAVQTIALGIASTYELAVFGDAPRVVAAGDGGLTATALCAE